MSSNLFWVDLEMTGLDVEKEVIIEVAVIVTDYKLNELETYHAVVKQPQSYIDKMDDWNKKTHKESGLIDQIPKGKDPAEVEKDLIALSKKHFGTNKVIIAGNSIGHDKLFLKQYFKQFSELLHYRLLDVTSWKLVFKDILKIKHDKKNTHRALDDIRESIDELKFYMKFIKVDEKTK
jgi:oligoribonuclease